MTVYAFIDDMEQIYQTVYDCHILTFMSFRTYSIWFLDKATVMRDIKGLFYVRCFNEIAEDIFIFAYTRRQQGKLLELQIRMDS